MTLLPAHGTVAGEVARALLVAAGFGGLFVAAEVWRRFANPPVEWTRKLVHVGGGIVVGIFPWLFTSHWTVLAVAVVAVLALGIARWMGLLKSVSGIDRTSEGDLLFPLAGYLLFLLAGSRPVFYVLSLSTLVFSDALAALVGRIYGRNVYAVGEGSKSLEGSAVFGIVTFVSVHLVLLLGTDLERLVCVLVAAQVALLVTSFEAISPRGSDNVFVPLGTLFLLVKMTPKAAPFLGLQLAAQVGLLAAALVLAWRTRLLTFSGGIAAHLVLYAALSLGGRAWLAAPAAALALYAALVARLGPGPVEYRGRYEVRTIFLLSGVAVACIFADNALRTGWLGEPIAASGRVLYALYLGAVAGPLAIVALELDEIRSGRAAMSAAVRAAAALGAAASVVLAAGLLAARPEGVARIAALASFVAAASLATHLALRSRLAPRSGEGARLRLAGFSTLLVVTATFLAIVAATRSWAGMPP